MVQGVYGYSTYSCGVDSLNKYADFILLSHRYMGAIFTADLHVSLDHMGFSTLS